MNKRTSFLIGVCAFPFIVLVSPFIILLLVFYAIYTATLYLLIWVFWLPKGKDILFVYSDSPVWREHVEAEILPHIEARAIILNWSERKAWSAGHSLPTLVFKHFGGYREFNPMGLYFRPFHFVKAYRFLNAFRDRKHGKPQALERIKGEFFSDISGKQNH